MARPRLFCSGQVLTMNQDAKRVTFWAGLPVVFNSWGTATFSLRREALSGETIRVFSGDST
jgi:hypothetical protein